MDGRFETTHWSLVPAARSGESEKSRIALETLCGAYWFPLYAFIRRQGYSSEDARDLTQGYFAPLLEHRNLRDVRPELGRFRSFLLASVKPFLSNELNRESAKKCSPGQPLISLDAGDAEQRYALEPMEAFTPETVFERKWAVTVLDRALTRLEGEWAGEERGPRFRALRGHLVGDEGAAPYRDVGASLGMSEDAITGGCGGGNFCPNANLTRRQMAVFLAKALGLHWPN